MNKLEKAVVNYENIRKKLADAKKEFSKTNSACSICNCNSEINCIKEFFNDSPTDGWGRREKIPMEDLLDEPDDVVCLNCKNLVRYVLLRKELRKEFGNAKRRLSAVAREIIKKDIEN